MGTGKNGTFDKIPDLKSPFLLKINPDIIKSFS